MLATDDGELLLRRQGGNPFSDETLESLVGKEIDGHGRLVGDTLIMDRWEEMDG
jgi:hypothetical protein